EPGKIDIAEFMLKNYTFNIAIERFAYLTGRSLATFKRDFQKAFNMPPQKWLLEKRLKQAHFLIAEKNCKPSDIYLEVGFENLSHFSNSFKQHFGYSPSSVTVSR
ncbi:MAG: AraC family transcriptional regulator, partial [Bacteroidetes bacterium]